MKATRFPHLLSGVLFAAAVGLATLTGAEAGMPDRMSSSMHVSEPADVTLVGSNICLSCYLKSRFNAMAACATTGHRHALKVSKARTMDGKALTEVEGWVVHYLPGASSKALVMENHGATVMVTGRLYPHERAFEVKAFEVQTSKEM
jgi:hypothetical protein